MVLPDRGVVADLPVEGIQIQDDHKFQNSKHVHQMRNPKQQPTLLIQSGDLLKV